MNILTTGIQSSLKMLSHKTNSCSQTNTQFALRFCLSYPQVVSAIPGILNEKEVKENIKASDLGPLQDNEIEDVQKTYHKLQFIFDNES